MSTMTETDDSLEEDPNDYFDADWSMTERNGNDGTVNGALIA